ncbi:MAG TPA: VWA domain-containing protein [Bryobacteraceae bacterium]|nr:VWA domain-containing protein [Bryobacteraceae bacterium]
MHLFNNARRAAALVAALGAAVLVSPVLRAQEEPTTPNFRSDARLVVLHASVADSRGRLLTALSRDAFRVYEDGIEQTIKTFKREDVPVSLALVIDNSGSMRDKRAKVEAAALAAVKASNPRDEVTIVNFNDEAWHDVPFTSDIRKMQEGLTRIDARGGTAMRDAISGTIDYVKEKGKHQKKVILVVTDGNDNTSSITLERLVQKAHQSEVLLYFIALLNEEDKREAKKAKRAIDALAKASGGSALYPEDLQQVESTALSVATEIRNQYIIAYTPSNTALDGSFRSIRVEARGPGRPIVRTRTGYYANPDQPARSATILLPGR